MNFKICIIGCGNHSKLVHGPSLKRYSYENPDVLLAGCSDIDMEKANSFKEMFGFKHAYIDMFQMLDCEKPDAVCLVVPVDFTAGLAEKILEMGYPLLMEKPPAKTGKEVKKLIEIVNKNKVHTQVAFNRRYTPLVRKLKEYLSTNIKPCDIQSIHYDLFRSNRTDSDFSTTAIHAVDAVRFIAGADYKQVDFRYQKLKGFDPCVNNVFIDSIMTNGAIARINICPVAGVVIERVTVNAHDNTFMLNIPMWNEYDYPGRLIHLRGGKVISDLNGNEISDGTDIFETGGFYNENASFFDDIRAGRKPAGGIETSLQSVEVADCIRKNDLEYISGKHSKD